MSLPENHPDNDILQVEVRYLDGTSEKVELVWSIIYELINALDVPIYRRYYKIKIFNPDGSTYSPGDWFTFEQIAGLIYNPVTKANNDFVILQTKDELIPKDPNYIPPFPEPEPEPEPGPEPGPFPGPEPEYNAKEFSQSYTAVTYETKPTGLELFVQVQVSKNREIVPTIIKSYLQILNQARQTILIKDQDLNIAGVNKFAIVYEIPDLRQATRDYGGGESLATNNIFVQHFIQTKEFEPLAPAIEVAAFLGKPTPAPGPKQTDGLFSKIVGVFAAMTAGTIMFSGRKR